MLPPCIHGGALLILPDTSGGATPMLPKKGRQGNFDSAPKRATPRFSSSEIISF